jgi:hypothetical protein
MEKLICLFSSFSSGVILRPIPPEKKLAFIPQRISARQRLYKISGAGEEIAKL